MGTKEQIVEIQRLVGIIVEKQGSSKYKEHNEARKAASVLKKLAGEFKKTSGLEDKAAKEATKASKPSKAKGKKK
jgi:hypothetical protein